MINKLILNFVYAIALLSLAGSATACYYGGDPVKTATGYDVPKSMTDGDCYYEADENVPLSQIEGEYYLAELSESGIPPVTREDKTLEQSEFSALEGAGTPVAASMSQRPAQHHSQTSYIDSDDHNWTPISWDLSY
jgi:hypothetical protein